MNDWDSDEHLARAADLPDMGDLLHAHLLEATSRVVRARRRRRMAMQLAAIVLAFVSGMLTMGQLSPSSTPSTTSAPSTITTAATDPGEPEATAGDPATPIYADPEAFAQAFDAASPEERLRLLRAAGDFELNDRGDVRTALAYYEQWVRLADTDTRAQYNENDTWLLASLKYGD